MTDQTWNPVALSMEKIGDWEAKKGLLSVHIIPAGKHAKGKMNVYTTPGGPRVSDNP
jgi:hypothetical protein